MVRHAYHKSSHRASKTFQGMFTGKLVILEIVVIKFKYKNKDTNKKIIFIILLIILAVSITGYLAFIKNPTPFVSQEKCEQKTGKKCFLFKGLCQVMGAQNQREEEENKKFLKDCEKKIGTWQPIEE